MPTLRHYQYDCVEAVFREWQKHTSTMVSMATGLGKSVIFAEIVRRMHPKRSIVIAHRDMLVNQAAAHIERTGIKTEIEMADKRADASLFGEPTAIVASVQTLNSKTRLEKFNPEDFGCLIIDECHHAVAKSYVKVVNHFTKNPALKIFGCTATPDRADDKALGKVFESVAYEYAILNGIKAGWLVDIDQQVVHVSELDYSHVRVTAGDLNSADLAAVLEDEKPLQKMVSATIEIIDQRKTIVFAASVRHAEKCCDIFNRHRQGMAAWICGETPDDKRQEVLRAFSDGKVQVFVNVAIASEGFDVADCEAVVMGRPTQSRAVFCQCIGRGTRPLAGILEGLHSAYERKEAIDSSAKKTCLVLDFVGNSGRHKLITTADILGGDYSDEVVTMATKAAKETEGPVRMSELLKESEKAIQKRIADAKAAEEARKAKIVAKVKFTVAKVSPFDLFGVTPKPRGTWDSGRQLSLKQRGILLKLGVDPDEVGYANGARLVAAQVQRWKKNLCTAKQCAALKKFGYDGKDMTMKEASNILDALAKNGWRRPQEAVA